MINYELGELFPRYVLNDRNGYAICKAIAAGIDYFLAACQDGLDCLQDVDKMPEWRLDEMAWEYGCLYDYGAPIESKREWIRNAYNYFRRHGTPVGIEQYLSGYFGKAVVGEWWEQDLDPGYFDIVIAGMRDEEKEKWLRAAVEKAKNVRSILNNILYMAGEMTHTQKAGAAIYAQEVHVHVTAV